MTSKGGRLIYRRCTSHTGRHSWRSDGTGRRWCAICNMGWYFVHSKPQGQK